MISQNNELLNGKKPRKHKSPSVESLRDKDELRIQRHAKKIHVPASIVSPPCIRPLPPPCPPPTDLEPLEDAEVDVALPGEEGVGALYEVGVGVVGRLDLCQRSRVGQLLLRTLNP